jgi:hypothetical protein
MAKVLFILGYLAAFGLLIKRLLKAGTKKGINNHTK